MIPAASTLRKGGDWLPSDGLDANHAGQLERPTHKTSFRAATPSPAGDRLLLRLCCPAHPREGVRGVGRRGKAPGGPGSAGAASSDLRADLFVPATLPAPLRPPVIPWSSCLLHLSALGPFTRGAAPAPVPPPETDADAGASPALLPNAAPPGISASSVCCTALSSARRRARTSPRLAAATFCATTWATHSVPHSCNSALRPPLETRRPWGDALSILPTAR